MYIIKITTNLKTYYTPLKSWPIIKHTYIFLMVEVMEMFIGFKRSSDDLS